MGPFPLDPLLWHIMIAYHRVDILKGFLPRVITNTLHSHCPGLTIKGPSNIHHLLPLPRQNGSLVHPPAGGLQCLTASRDPTSKGISSAISVTLFIFGHRLIAGIMGLSQFFYHHLVRNNISSELSLQGGLCDV